MKSSNHIIDVSETDFQNEVIAYSAQFPVIVDFWADWCIPCRTLGPILEKLANEAQGAFRLAKVNVDENPNLANHYMIASIPAVKAFRDGQVVNEFIGVKPEPDLRQFLRELAPSQSDLKLEKGINLLRAAQWTNAAEVFREVLRSSPDHSQALLGLAKSLLAQGRSPDALIILREF
ncbi:MAG: thioredoxin, partial [Anaerolineae bacterium]|nr:thioredoxin [Anaerolineae bacterium]